MVFMEQLRIGNTSIGNSNFGTPSPMQTDFTVSVKDQGRSSTAQTTNFTGVLLLQASEFAYVAEMINQTPELNIPGLSGQPLVYARTIF